MPWVISRNGTPIRLVWKSEWHNVSGIRVLPADFGEVGFGSSRNRKMRALYGLESAWRSLIKRMEMQGRNRMYYSETISLLQKLLRRVCFNDIGLDWGSDHRLSRSAFQITLLSLNIQTSHVSTHFVDTARMYITLFPCRN
jgi:hypothetical protein